MRGTLDLKKIVQNRKQAVRALNKTAKIQAKQDVLFEEEKLAFFFNTQEVNISNLLYNQQDNFVFNNEGWLLEMLLNVYISEKV